MLTINICICKQVQKEGGGTFLFLITGFPKKVMFQYPCSPSHKTPCMVTSFKQAILTKSRPYKTLRAWAPHHISCRNNTLDLFYTSKLKRDNIPCYKVVSFSFYWYHYCSDLEAWSHFAISLFLYMGDIPLASFNTNFRLLIPQLQKKVRT